MTFHERLRELRGDRTQTEIANLIGVKPNNYNGWENGKTPNIETLIKIADYYNLTLDYLLGRVDYKNGTYARVVIKPEQTGLTEKAICGLQCIQNRSSKNNNRMAALNFLLEKEAEQHSMEQYMFHEILSLISNENLYYDPDLSDLNASDRDKALITFFKRSTMHLIFAKNVPLMLMAWRSQFQSSKEKEQNGMDKSIQRI